MTDNKINHYQEGCMQVQKRNYPSAIHHFNLMIEEDPKFFKAYFNKAVTLQLCGQITLAI